MVYGNQGVIKGLFRLKNDKTKLFAQLNYIADIQQTTSI